MKTLSKLLILCFLIQFSINSIQAQGLDLNKVPKQEHLDEGKKIANTFFENLKNKNYNTNAEYIVNNIGNSWDESKKISVRNEYLAKFELMNLSPPKGVYGALDDYDLIEQGFIIGSNRIFRHTYIGYHEGSFLIYEFRFYINSLGKVSLHYIGWSDKNPFEYMSTPDMMLPRYDF